jgi:hypothetical protein
VEIQEELAIEKKTKLWPFSGSGSALVGEGG